MSSNEQHHERPAARQPGAFIVGMSRAATTWMCKCLNEHPQVAAFGESLFWGRRFLPPEGDGRYTPAQLEALYDFHKGGTMIHAVVGEGPGNLRRLNRENLPERLREAFDRAGERPTPAELFIAICDMVAEAEEKPMVVEKTPHHLRWIDRIEAALPGSRYIVMIREPYGFMLSYKHQGDRKREEVRRRFRRRWHPFACALVWRSYMKAMDAAAARHGDQTLVVHFGDVQSNPGDVLDRVQRFLGVDVTDLTGAVPKDNTSFVGVRPTLAPEDYFWLNLVAGRIMKRHGIGRQTGRFAPVRTFWSVCLLPRWAVLNLIDMSRLTSGSVLGYLRRAVSGT